MLEKARHVHKPPGGAREPPDQLENVLLDAHQ
jgi:hypothetical protein